MSTNLSSEDLLFAQVILPLAIPKPYSYSIPEELKDQVKPGIRVEVQFGKSKLYSGLVISVENVETKPYKVKPILTLLDDQPIISSKDVQFWKWISQYYQCTLGEVMNAALPASLKLTSETTIILNPGYQEDFEHLNDKEYLIAEALSIQHELKIQDIQDILQQKTVYPTIQSLLKKGILLIKEELHKKYKPRKAEFVELHPDYSTNPQDVFELTKRSEKQTEVLLHYFKLRTQTTDIQKKDLYLNDSINSSTIRALEKKGIFVLSERVVSRISWMQGEIQKLPDLTAIQQDALVSINLHFSKQQPVLLHGITGSGKTRIYMELAREVINSGKQVLYLLPEIGLTTQIIERVNKVFGSDSLIFHSKLNNNERVEVWKSTHAGKPLILGARSALFLPFRDLGLIIVDEEHDPSYKQDDPAPRYNARDSALVLAKIWNAQIVLGSATPAFESYYNTQNHKYALVEISERIGSAKLPEIEIIDLKPYVKKRLMVHEYSPILLERIQKTLLEKRQIILFQNRRGFSPYLHCKVCKWHAQCIHCDVSQTYHRYLHKLVCHYCSYQSEIPKFCPDCGSSQLELKGFGTEKLESNLKELFPLAKVARMDLDSVRTRRSQENLLNDLSAGKIDILIGTQMVTKGLDFEGIGLVGIILVDQLLSYPDFRATERAFQLITQVSGRAGRKDKKGQVVIQTYHPEHPVLKDVIKGHYPSFYAKEMADRKQYLYPPYTRIILIILKHKKPRLVQEAAKSLSNMLRKTYGGRIRGPSEPIISRVRNQYIRHVYIKMEKNPILIDRIKQDLHEFTAEIRQQTGYGNIRINIDVDPY